MGLHCFKTHLLCNISDIWRIYIFFFHALKPKETPKNCFVQRSLGPRFSPTKIFGHDQELDLMINLKPAQGKHGKNLDGG